LQITNKNNTFAKPFKSLEQMKLNYKNQKIKIFSLLLMLVGIVSLGFFVQSCTEDALDNNMNEDMSINAKYLDLDIMSTTLSTPEKINIIRQASYRIITHMVLDGNSDKYVFELKSPAEINVSERLFNYVYPGIHVGVVDDVPRLKPDDCECTTTNYFGWSQTTCYYNDQQMMNYYESNINAASTASQYIGNAAIGIGVTPGGQTLGAGLGILSQAISAQGSTIDQSYHEYMNTSNRTGGTATETRVNVPNAGYVTTYDFKYTKK